MKIIFSKPLFMNMLIIVIIALLLIYFLVDDKEEEVILDNVVNEEVIIETPKLKETPKIEVKPTKFVEVDLSYKPRVDKYEKLDFGCYTKESGGLEKDKVLLENVSLENCKVKCSNTRGCKGIIYEPQLQKCIGKGNEFDDDTSVNRELNGWEMYMKSNETEALDKLKNICGDISFFEDKRLHILSSGGFLVKTRNNEISITNENVYFKNSVSWMIEESETYDQYYLKVFTKPSYVYKYFCSKDLTVKNNINDAEPWILDGFKYDYGYFHIQNLSGMYLSSISNEMKLTNNKSDSVWNFLVYPETYNTSSEYLGKKVFIYNDGKFNSTIGKFLIGDVDEEEGLSFSSSYKAYPSMSGDYYWILEKKIGNKYYLKNMAKNISWENYFSGDSSAHSDTGFIWKSKEKALPWTIEHVSGKTGYFTLKSEQGETLQTSTVEGEPALWSDESSDDNNQWKLFAIE